MMMPNFRCCGRAGSVLPFLAIVRARRTARRRVAILRRLKENAVPRGTTLVT